MITKTAKFRAMAWATAALIGLVMSPAYAQSRGGGSSRSSSGASSAGGAAGQLDRPPNGEVGPANFYVDQDSHRLIITADQQTAGYVSNVVASLERPKPQVLIKVVFLQVTYNKGYDVGLEGGVTKKINSTTTLSASNAFNLLQQGVTPTTGVNTLPGAGLYTLVGDDWSATLRAIEEVGKVEVLSRPTIMTRNNQQATVVVGQEVPVINGVNYDTFGNEHSSIQYQNVGVILQVTPFITSDDQVEMILAPQISSVANQSTLISSGSNGIVSTPYINVESANTVVVTPTGRTVAIGGLMQDSKSTIDSKIPLLGDIPGLGLLFHHKVSSVTKTELIIFLTPYVIRSPNDLTHVTADEKSRLELAPKSFPAAEMHDYLTPDTQPVPPAAPTPAGSGPHRR